MINKIYEWLKEFIKENLKSLIVLLIIILLFTIELPYSIYTPGGAVNLNDRILVNDGYESEGSFNMAYVSMVKGSIPFLLLSYVIPDWDIVSQEEITNDGESMSDMLAREKLYLQESIDAAVINAYQNAGKEITITKINNEVSFITSDAKTNLKIGDKIIRVHDTEIHSLEELKEVVSSLEKNQKVDIKVERDGKEKDLYATTYETDDGIKIGISIITTYEYETDPEVTVKSKSSEAGSSGGLMMSLTIYNELVSEDITKGKKIVGTGTIDINGNVGEIGGVKYKLIGAVKNKAEVFICPEENYEEAASVAEEKGYDITIIHASTFDEVLKKLEDL